ncbi:hypothetical protein KAU08_10325, partial [bacterium]|nr:hypothetical protein [bacterium]
MPAITKKTYNTDMIQIKIRQNVVYCLITVLICYLLIPYPTGATTLSEVLVGIYNARVPESLTSLSFL